MKNVTIKELMTAHPVSVSPSATLQEAALLMKQADCGALPVGTEDKVQGIITDRDIVLRAISVGKNPAKEKVQDYMTPHVYACRDTDFLENALEKMHQHKISRLVVKNSTGKAVGIISLGSILRKEASIKDITTTIEHAESKTAHTAW